MPVSAVSMRNHALLAAVCDAREVGTSSRDKDICGAGVRGCSQAPERGSTVHQRLWGSPEYCV